MPSPKSLFAIFSQQVTSLLKTTNSLDALEQDIISLADSNERRGLVFSTISALLTTVCLPVIGIAMGYDFVDRGVAFWLGLIIIEGVVALATWCIVLLKLVPPRDDLNKMITAVQFAAKNPKCVRINKGGQEFSILMKDEHITVTGAEATLFRKYWQD